MRRSIKGIPEKQIIDPHYPATSDPVCRHTFYTPYTTIRHGRNQNLHMLFKDLQITDTILDELRTDQLPGIVPLVQIRREDAVAEEIMPVLVEGLALAVVAELRCENGFDVLWVGSEDDALAGNARLDCLATRLAVLGKVRLPDFEVLVGHGALDAFVDYVEAWGGN